MINAQSNARHSLQQMKPRPQNVHKRHGCVTSNKHFAFRNSETCIFVRLLSKQCHDMLDFKTKLNGTKLNGTMIPVSFFVHCSCISMKTSHIFFRAIHHIDPLHRKQTLTLSHNAILEISQTAPTETSRNARNVKEPCWPIVTCFSNIQRTYKNMDVHSVHNASCLYVHV